MANGRGGVVGVLLAAGRGTRFEDGHKLLEPVAGRADEPSADPAPVVRHAASRLVAAPVDDAVAVLGHEASRVRAALEGVEIETVVNPEYASGQASSVARGVEWARRRDADAALFALGDMPWVGAETYRRIVDCWRETGSKIVLPEHEERRGNPVLFANTHFDALSAVSGDVGGRELIEQYPVERIAVDDPGILRDVNRVADLDDEPGE